MVEIPLALLTAWIGEYPDRHWKSVREIMAGEIARAQRPTLVPQIVRLPAAVGQDERWDHSRRIPLSYSIKARAPVELLRTPDYPILRIRDSSSAPARVTGGGAPE